MTTAASISTAPVSMLTFGSASLVSVPANVAGGFVLGPDHVPRHAVAAARVRERVAVGAAERGRRALHRVPARGVALLRRPAGRRVRVPGRHAAAAAGGRAARRARGGRGARGARRRRSARPTSATAAAGRRSPPRRRRCSRRRLLLAPAAGGPPDRPTLTFLDVGEGAATLLQVPGGPDGARRRRSRAARPGTLRRARRRSASTCSCSPTGTPTTSPGWRTSSGASRSARRCCREPPAPSAPSTSIASAAARRRGRRCAAATAPAGLGGRRLEPARAADVGPRRRRAATRARTTTRWSRWSSWAASARCCPATRRARCSRTSTCPPCVVVGCRTTAARAGSTRRCSPSSRRASASSPSARTPTGTRPRDARRARRRRRALRAHRPARRRRPLGGGARAWQAAAAGAGVRARARRRLDLAPLEAQHGGRPGSAAATTTVATSGTAHCAGSPRTIASPAAGRPAGVARLVTSNCASTSRAAYTPMPAPEAAAAGA